MTTTDTTTRGRGTFRWWRIAAATAVASAVAACAPGPGPTIPAVTTTTVPEGYPTTPVGDDQVRLNQIQLVGAHNSYHIAPDATYLSNIAALVQSVGGLGDLGDPAELDYQHASIPQQLARGLRTFEFDVYADPEGGRFANPRVPQLLLFNDPLLPAGLGEPGFKVLHIADLDYRTWCTSLADCLGELADYSDAHPGHLPMVVNLELKSTGLPPELGGAFILPFDGPMLDAVDAEIEAVLGGRLLSPDDVRGAAPDLRTAVTTTGWPTIAEARGKILVFMDNADLRDAYLAGHPSLSGRAMFTSSGQDQPDGAVLKVNEPGDGTAIAALVADGYLVRTRADAGLVGDPARRDVALSSGAQIVHTDYPTGEPQAGTGYIVDLGLPVAGRCNPVTTTPGTCQQAAVVEPNP